MTPNDEIQALLFDVGQVIIRVNVQRAARRLAEGASTTPEQVIAAIEADPQMRSFQEGRLTPEQWHQHLCNRLGLRLSFEEFCQAWNSALEPEPLLDGGFFSRLAPELRLALLSNTDPIHVRHFTVQFEFFSRLAPELRLALLSNTDPIHVRHFEAQFELFSLFPVRMYSCELGLRKPSPAIRSWT